MVRRSAIRRGLTALGYAVAAIAGVVATYLLAAWLGSSLARNADWTEPRDGIDILVETNGAHTGLVLPIVSSEFDWRTVFPSAGTRRADGQLPTHIAVGWGEREVFLYTPTWGDLKAATAFRIATTGGESLLRVGHYAYPQPSPNHRLLRVRPKEYRRMVAAIRAALPPAETGIARRTYTSFEPNALLYDARGRYTLRRTCNQWISDVLAAGGIRTARWAPFAGGVMKWVPPYEEGDRLVYASAS